jgi:DNA-binding SARP family transcriptional activator/tetratricopeptide (TPR) repeat protein
LGSARIRILGPVQVLGPDGPALLVGARQRAVAGLLAVKAGAVVPRWRLVDALWGEEPPRTAIKSLHSHVARVRQALAVCGLPDILLTREPGYQLAVSPEAVDAWRFEESVRRGREELSDGSAERAVAQLRNGLALWQGEVALADAEPTGWGAAEVERLSEVRLTAIESRWDAELRLGRHVAAAGELERLLVAHPYRERLVELYLLALYRGGQYTSALEAFQRFRARLADEFGADPGPAVSQLHTLILRRDPSLDTQPAPARMPAPAQLPARVGHFTGRAPEMVALDGLLDPQPDEDTRIAVISGPAGIGKTSLAVQWAHRVLDRFPDGQLFVDAASTGALAHLLRSLGVTDDRLPAELAEQATLYRSLLSGRRMLIVADDASSADSVLPLVPASAGNLLVVTSRGALAALTTHHSVRSIQLHALTDTEALALLSKLLGQDAVDREPAAAIELVRLCDRLPLAVRIAAAKLADQHGIAAFVTELAGANRLDALTVDGGSRSVRAVFASAYRALSAPAARLFRLLGLLPGPTFHAQLGAALAGRPAVAELANAHLISPAGANRYRFHDLVALFAGQCAAVDELPGQRDEAVARAVDWYLAVADGANKVVDPGRDRVTVELRYPPDSLPFAADPESALSFLESERGNLIPITQFTAETGFPQATCQLTYLLTGFYDSRGHWQERVQLCSWGVTAAQRTGDPGVEGLMRSALGVACIMTRQFDKALESLYLALPLMRVSDDQRGIGHVYNNIAAAYSGLRRFDDAVDAFRQALAVHTASGHRLGVALALNNTGHTYVRMGRPELSRPDLSQALQISREIGNPRLEAAVLHSLGEADLRAGSMAGALAYLGEALLVYQRIGDRQYQAETLNGLGLAYLGDGDPAAATTRLREALELTREIADRHLEAVTLHHLGQVQLAAGDLADAAEQLRLALALRAQAPDAYEEAHLHRDLATLARQGGDPASAEHHRGLAVGLYRKANAAEEADQLLA